MSHARYKRNVPTARELRRMQERDEKREQNRQALNAWWALSPEERQRRIQDHETVQRIQRNGITIEDLDRTAQDAYKDGAKYAAEKTKKNIYAACALVLHEMHGFGKKRCMDVLNAIDQKVLYALDTQEMIQQVWNDLGIMITFDGDPLDERIVDEEV